MNGTNQRMTETWMVVQAFALLAVIRPAMILLPFGTVYRGLRRLVVPVDTRRRWTVDADDQVRAVVG